MSSSPVKLGDLILTGIEVPDSLQIGGQQRMMIHQFLGGGRSIDVSGKDFNNIEIKGTFLGQEAKDKVLSIDRMYKKCDPIPFFSSDFFYNIIIRNFYYNYQRKGLICNYYISVEIIDEKNDSELSYSNKLPEGLDTISLAYSSIDTNNYIFGSSINAIGNSEKIKDNFQKISEIFYKLRQGHTIESKDIYYSEILPIMKLSGESIDSIVIKNSESLIEASANSMLHNLSYDIGVCTGNPLSLIN